MKLFLFPNDRVCLALFFIRDHDFVLFIFFENDSGQRHGLYSSRDLHLVRAQELEELDEEELLLFFTAFALLWAKAWSVFKPGSTFSQSLRSSRSSTRKSYCSSSLPLLWPSPWLPLSCRHCLTTPMDQPKKAVVFDLLHWLRLLLLLLCFLVLRLRHWQSSQRKKN